MAKAVHTLLYCVIGTLLLCYRFKTRHRPYIFVPSGCAPKYFYDDLQAYMCYAFCNKAGFRLVLYAAWHGLVRNANEAAEVGN